MRIGIVLHPYGEDKPGGLARTILEWTKGLLNIEPDNEFIIFLKQKPCVLPELPRKRWKIEVLGQGLFWLNRLKKVTPVDVCIFQTPVLPIFYRPKRSIIIAQDFPYRYLKPKNIKEYIRNIILGLYHRFSLHKADMIVAVSRSTKNDVTRFFGISENKIKVIHMGFKKICDAPQIEVKLPEKFFLFVGVIKERKNVFNIVRAFAGFQKAHADSGYKLAIGGKAEGKYYEAIRNYLTKEKMENKVVFLGYLNDGQLSCVYRKAAALIFPSIVEGFGFPVLEAMHCGLPVITSNFGGPAETGADNAAILVDPHDPNAIKNAMEKVVFDPDFKEQLVKRGLEQSKNFSWDKAAKELMRLIKTICQKD